MDSLCQLFAAWTHSAMPTVRGGATNYRELVDACCHALGDDVAVEVVGSRARGTHFAGADVDLQVRRSPRSDQADILFTDTDKRKVAQNWRSWHVSQGLSRLEIFPSSSPCKAKILFLLTWFLRIHVLRIFLSFVEGRTSTRILRASSSFSVVKHGPGLPPGLLSLESNSSVQSIPLTDQKEYCSMPLYGAFQPIFRWTDRYLYRWDCFCFLIMSWLLYRIGRVHLLDVTWRKIWTSYPRGNGTNIFTASRRFGGFHIRLWGIFASSTTLLAGPGRKVRP